MNRTLKMLARSKILLLLTLTGLSFAIEPVSAEKIPNPVAEFSGLDKITGRIIKFDVYMNHTIQFGTLRVTPRVCNSRPLTAEPNTVGFVEVDEVTLEGDLKRIFTGWMFVASPALHAVEHGIYDVWLTDCKNRTYKKKPENYDGLPVIVLEQEEQPQQNNDQENDSEIDQEEIETDSNLEIDSIPLPKRRPE